VQGKLYFYVTEYSYGDEIDGDEMGHVAGMEEYPAAVFARHSFSLRFLMLTYF
jgi:hypothetical protein